MVKYDVTKRWGDSPYFRAYQGRITGKIPYLKKATREVSKWKHFKFASNIQKKFFKKKKYTPHKGVIPTLKRYISHGTPWTTYVKKGKEWMEKLVDDLGRPFRTVQNAIKGYGSYYQELIDPNEWNKKQSAKGAGNIPLGRSGSRRKIYKAPRAPFSGQSFIPSPNRPLSPSDQKILNEAQAEYASQGGQPKGFLYWRQQQNQRIENQNKLNREKYDKEGKMEPERKQVSGPNIKKPFKELQPTEKKKVIGSRLIDDLKNMVTWGNISTAYNIVEAVTAIASGGGAIYYGGKMVLKRLLGNTGGNVVTKLARAVGKTPSGKNMMSRIDDIATNISNFVSSKYGTPKETIAHIISPIRSTHGSPWSTPKAPFGSPVSAYQSPFAGAGQRTSWRTRQTRRSPIQTRSRGGVARLRY